MSINNHSASLVGITGLMLDMIWLNGRTKGRTLGAFVYICGNTHPCLWLWCRYTYYARKLSMNSQVVERESKTLERRQQEFTTFGSLHRLSENIKPLEKANPQQIMGGWSDQIN